MKKFYALLAAMAVTGAAMAANPTLYLRGDINGWGTTHQMTENNGVYTISLDELSGTFKIADASWSSAANYGAGSDAVAAVGKSLKLNNGSNTNINCGGKTIENVTLTFTLSNTTLEISGTAVDNDYSTVYLVGDFGSGWSTDITNYPLTSTNGTTWTGEYSLNGTTYFKMKAGTLIYGTGGEDINVEMGQAYTANQEGNAYVLGKGTYTFTFELEKNAATGTLTVTGEGVQPDTNYSSWYVNVLGPFNSWTDNGVNPVDGISTTTDLQIGTEGFKIKVWNTVDDIYYITGDDTPIALDTWVTVYPDAFDGPRIYIDGATANDVYTVKFDCAKNQVYVTKTGSTVEIPETLYIIGDVNGTNWSSSNGVTMNNEGDGIFTAEKVKIQSEIDEDYGFFSFTTALAATFEELGTRYGAETNDYLLNCETGVEVEADLYRGLGDNAFKVPKGIYTITVQFDEDGTITLVVERTGNVSGVENLINDENAPVEYFNLQGVRVANPAAGQLVIKRQGTTVTKVLVK